MVPRLAPSLFLMCGVYMKRCDYQANTGCAHFFFKSTLDRLVCIDYDYNCVHFKQQVRWLYSL